MKTITTDERILCVRTVRKFDETFRIIEDTTIKSAPIYKVWLTAGHNTTEIYRSWDKAGALEFFYNIYNLAEVGERDGWKELSKYE